MKKDKRDLLKPVVLRKTHPPEKKATRPASSPPADETAAPPAAAPPAPAKPPSPASTTPAPPRKKAAAAPQSRSRELVRRPCSFPAILRLMLPELTFTPIAMPVRVVDLSPTGARLEIAQLDHELYLQAIAEPRYVRLEILVPTAEKLQVAGRLVWIEHDATISTVGISISPSREDLARECLPEWDARAATRSNPVLPPSIEHYPVTTGKSPFKFVGTAIDAESVIVESTAGRAEVPVVAGAFTVKVPLALNAYNELKFFARAGEAISDPTPVWISHQAGQPDTQTLVPGKPIFQDVALAPDGGSLTIKFKGRPREIGEAMQRLEEVMGLVENCAMHVQLFGDAQKLARCLKHGGKYPAKKD